MRLLLHFLPTVISYIELFSNYAVGGLAGHSTPSAALPMVHMREIRILHHGIYNILFIGYPWREQPRIRGLRHQALTSCFELLVMMVGVTQSMRLAHWLPQISKRLQVEMPIYIFIFVISWAYARCHGCRWWAAQAKTKQSPDTSNGT